MKPFDKDAERSVPLRRSARAAQARLTQENPDSPSPSQSSAQRRASARLSTASESSSLLQRSSGNNVGIPSFHPSVVRSPPIDIPTSSHASGRILRLTRALQISHPDILQRTDSSFARQNQRPCTASHQPSQQLQTSDVNPECISHSSELASTSRGNDQQPFRSIVQRRFDDAITDQLPKVCRISKSGYVRSGTSSSSTTSGFFTSVSMSSPLAASSTASTSTGRTSSTTQSVLSLLLKSQLPSTSAANIPKPIKKNIVLVPLKETGSPCLDLANVDSTDTSADNSAAGVSDTDSSISSSLFAWSISSGGSAYETTRPLSDRSGSSSSIAVITNPGDEQTNDDTAEDVSSEYKDIEEEEPTTESSLNSFSLVDPEEEPDDNIDLDDDDDTKHTSSSWTDVTGDSKDDELVRDDGEKRKEDNTER